MAYDTFGGTPVTTDPFGGELAEGGPPKQRRNLAALANDTVIEVANAAAGGVSSAANFIRPGNAVSGWIDKNIVQAGEASQSDLVRTEKQRFQQDVANSQGVMDELGAVGRYVVNNPLLSAAQAAGSFVAPGLAVKGGRTLASVAGLNAARGGLAGGAAAGAAMAGGDAAGTAYELSTKAGATDEQGVAAGRQASVLPAVIGGLGGLVGAERLVAGAKGFGGNAVSRALKTGAVEGAQEAVEEGVTQYEGQRAAMPFDKTIDPTKGVAAAAGMGAALGGITGAGASLLTGGHQQQDPAAVPLGADDPSVGEPAAPAIDPIAGPLSKAASLAGEMGLAPQSAQPTAPDQRAAMEATISRLPDVEQREARVTVADLGNQALPAGVRAMREARLQELLSGAPAAPIDVAPADMAPGRIVRSFDARSGEAPPTRLSIVPDQGAPDGIDFTAAAAPDPEINQDSERIAQLALASDLQPGEPMPLNRAHALRRAAAAEGITMSVIPHASGRGYDVAPTARLDPAARAAMPQNETAAQLPFDQRDTGRMVGTPGGDVRQETRAEAVARTNAATAQRQEVEAERQRRTELGLSNITPVTPLREGGGKTPPPLTLDNAPTGGTAPDGASGPQVRQLAGLPLRTTPATAEFPGGQEVRNTGQTAQSIAPNATNSIAERGAKWRVNAMQANRVARGLGIETKGKPLEQVLADIDASDAQGA